MLVVPQVLLLGMRVNQISSKVMSRKTTGNVTGLHETFDLITRATKQLVYISNSVDQVYLSKSAWAMQARRWDRFGFVSEVG